MSSAAIWSEGCDADAAAADGVSALEAIEHAVCAGDYERALMLACRQGEQLRAQRAGGALPPPSMLRQWLDGYQGLIGHVETLREETHAQLRSLQNGRAATRAYTHG